MASTMEPLEKNVRISGNWLAISFCTRSMYSKLLELMRVVQCHLDGGRVGPGVGGVQ